MSENCPIKNAVELYCYKLTATLDDPGDDTVICTETIYVVAPDMADACAWACEIYSRVISAEYIGAGAIGRNPWR